MDPETARTLGYALGLATMGFVVFKVFTRDRKPPPPSLPRYEGPNLAGVVRTLVVLVVVAAVAAALGWLLRK